MNVKGLFSNLRGDVFGGVTAGVVALPLALAFGVQSGLGAEAGLYGAIFLGFFASFFGGTPSQISGPTGPMTVVTASVVVSSMAGGLSPENTLALMILIFVFSGLFQVLFGMIKLGKYIKYIPYPVLSGFMSGIGIIIILMQIYPLFGYRSPSSTLDIVGNLGETITEIKWDTLMLAAGTILIVYLWPFLTKKVPGTLIALIVMTVVSVYMQYDPALTIGSIPQGLPEFKAVTLFPFDPALMMMALIPALTLAGLGAIDTLLTSVVADNLTHTRHNSNKELIGQGIGNAVAGLFGGIPGAGATMRTVVNVKSGGRGALSGMLHSAILLLMLLGLGPYVALIPNAVLAGILITVGISIIDMKGIRDILAIPKADAAVLIAVLLLTVFVDLLQAVGIGMVIASVLFMKRAGDLVEKSTEVTPVSVKDHETPWDDEKDVNPEVFQKVHIMRLDGPLFFGVVSKFRETLSEVPDGVELVIIRMKKVAFMDMSGIYALEEAIRDLKGRKISVALTMVQTQPMYLMRKVSLVPDLVPEESVFPTFTECADHLAKAYSEAVKL